MSIRNIDVQNMYIPRSTFQHFKVPMMLVAFFLADAPKKKPTASKKRR